ncbi:MAG: extracellular solute-binding protein [Clostridiales bacterium]|nr:extracellular solute-binding protein [Clostridiales bacterium]
MKKLLATLLASTMALTTIGSLVACGDDNKGGVKGLEIPTGNIELKVWAPDGAIALYEGLVDTFKAAHKEAKNWTVTFEAKGEGDAASAVRTDPQTGPHIYFLASDQVDGCVEQAALQKLPEQFAKEVKKRDLEATVKLASKNNDIYAFPNVNSNGYFLIYDTEFFTPNEVKSLDTMVAKATANGKKIIFDYDNAFYNPTFFWGMGVKVGDTDGEITVDSDEGIEAGKTFIKYFGTGATGVWAKSGGNNGTAEGFKRGDVVASVSGTWANENNVLDNMADNTEGWTRERIAYTKLPMFTDTQGVSHQMGSFMGAKYTGVNPSKPEKEILASLHLANWFNTAENQAARYEATKEAPTNNAALDDDRVKTNPMLKALSEQNEAGGRWQTNVPDTWWTPMGTWGGNIYDGVTTLNNIEDAMAALATALKNVYLEA